jgi:predicted N-acetyltransferase YhbS
MHPEWTRRRAGRSLSVRCIADVRAAGATRFVRYANLNAVDFYARLGFNANCRAKIPLGVGRSLPAMLMEQTH